MSERTLRSTRRGVLAMFGAAAAGRIAGGRPLEQGAGDWPQSGYGPGNSGHAPRNVGPRRPVEPRFAREATGPPVLADGTLYVGGSDFGGSETGRYLFAVDPADGSVRWRYRTGALVTLPPAVADGSVYVADGEGVVHAVDAADGSERWRTDRRFSLFPPLTVADGTVLVRDEQRVLAALSTADGSERWTYSQVVGGAARGGFAVDDGVVYTFSTGGCLALSLADGSTVWGPNGARCYGEPAAVGDAVYAGVATGGSVGLAAFDAADGSERWRFVPAYGLKAPAAVTDGAVYVGSDGFTVHAVDAADGSERWRFRTEGTVRAPLAVAGDTLYAGCADGHVYALATADGTERWRFETGAVTFFGPAVGGGSLYVTADDGTLYALSPGGAVPSVTPLAPATTDSGRPSTASPSTTTTASTTPRRSTDGASATNGTRKTPGSPGGDPTANGPARETAPAGQAGGTSGSEESVPVVPVLGGLAGAGGAWAAYRRFGTTDTGDEAVPWLSGEGGPPETVPGAPAVSVGYDDFERGPSIGTGGEAEVYEVTVAGDGGEVTLALKEPRATETLRRAEYDRFLEEAETWDRLDDHEGVVDVVAWGADPLPWIAMEYMDGGTLGERRGDLTRAQRFWTAVAVTRAVRHAHRHGVTHLDVTPSNVLFRRVDGAWDVPKVADWGMARALLDDDGVAGFTPQYAAPEQLAPDRFGDPDERTDVYQVGAVSYYLFTGDPPADGSPAAILEAVTGGAVPAPTDRDPSLPPGLDDVLGRALAADPGDRYETAVHLRDALIGVARSLE